MHASTITPPGVIVLALAPIDKNTPAQETSRVLADAFQAAMHGAWLEARRLVLLMRDERLDDPKHTWGDTTLGGGMGLLELAADLGSPALVRRCLEAGCRPNRRTLICAWRSASPLVILLLEDHQGSWKRAWADETLEHDVAKLRSQREQKQMEIDTEDANGKARSGRL